MIPKREQPLQNHKSFKTQNQYCTGHYQQKKKFKRKRIKYHYINKS